MRRTLGESIDIRTAFTSGLASIFVDPGQLENALVNLMVNARDAMPSGGRITIESRIVHLDEHRATFESDLAPGDYVTLSVSDTGSGIPAEIVGRVFEPFYTTKRVGEGSGLGLSMVYGFVKQSGGHVTITSELDHGTTVNIYLPQSRESATPEDAVVDTSKFAPGSERILVVEDNANLRKLPTGILRRHGYEIVEAGDGKEALDHMSNSTAFDLLFTDIVLPGGMSGMDIAVEATRLHPNIKVLYTTGYAKKAIIQGSSLEEGMALINKPYRRAELLEKVRLVLDSKDD